MLLRRTVGILVAISIIVAGVCLAVGCCYIYFSDGITYSRIAVADVFAVICIPVYICLFLVVFGFLAELFLPDAVSKKSNVSVSSVKKVNNMLKEGKQINIKHKGTLPTEIRILAVIRLGITESRKIAEFLNTSVNTIYTYRTKMRYDSIDGPDKFEENVKNIDYFKI